MVENGIMQMLDIRVADLQMDKSCYVLQTAWDFLQMRVVNDQELQAGQLLKLSMLLQFLEVCLLQVDHDHFGWIIQLGQVVELVIGYVIRALPIQRYLRWLKSDTMLSKFSFLILP